MTKKESIEKDEEISDLEIKDDKVSEMLSTVVPLVKNLSDRLERIETGGKNDFKKEAKNTDIESVKSTREGIDPKTIAIVDETLGEDFGIDISPNKDNPGFLFTILVPKRLSSVAINTHPVLLANGEPRKDEKGVPVFEDYWPGDRRSRQIASWQNFDAIKEHCEKVRAHIVSYYQKSKQPLPEFRLKSYTQ